MRPTRIWSLLLVFAIASHVPNLLTTAQNVTRTQEALFSVFDEGGLVRYKALAESFYNTTRGQAYLKILSTGDHIVFAPTDPPIWSLPESITSNPEELNALFSYHSVFGSVDPERKSKTPNDTIRQTALDASTNKVFLEGNKSQVIAWTYESLQDVAPTFLDQAPVIEGNGSIADTGSGNITVFVLPQFFQIPGSLPLTVNIENITTFETLMQQSSLDKALNATRGFTLFLPEDSAFTSQINFTTFTSNSTLFSIVMGNHYLNGSTLYTPNLISLSASSSSAISASGEPLTFSTNSSGTYVHSQSIVSRIVQSDILLQNGVVHIVDAFLLNTQADSSAASSAFASATSAGGQAAQATVTGPIGFTPSPTPVGSGASTLKFGGGVNMLLIVTLGGILSGLFHVL